MISDNGRLCCGLHVRLRELERHPSWSVLLRFSADPVFFGWSNCAVKYNTRNTEAQKLERRIKELWSRAEHRRSRSASDRLYGEIARARLRALEWVPTRER